MSNQIRILRGNVRKKGFGVASERLERVEHLIIERTGLPSVQRGTLNIPLLEPYIVPTKVQITHEEYGYTDDRGRPEFLKLQRCVIRGVRAVIMRPNTHELDPPAGWGKNHLELMSHYDLCTHLNLKNREDVEVEVGGDEDWWYGAQ